MKFKVGDKVKIISKSNFNVFKIGEKLEVIEPCSGDGDYYYCRSLNGSSSVLQIIMERDLVLSNNRGKNKRGKDGRFIKEAELKEITLEEFRHLEGQVKILIARIKKDVKEECQQITLKSGHSRKDVKKKDVLNNHELRLKRIEQYLDLDK